VFPHGHLDTQIIAAYFAFGCYLSIKIARHECDSVLISFGDLSLRSDRGRALANVSCNMTPASHDSTSESTPCMSQRSTYHVIRTSINGGMLRPSSNDILNTNLGSKSSPQSLSIIKSTKSQAFSSEALAQLTTKHLRHATRRPRKLGVRPN
jgi:hypothetical protein